MLPRRNRTSRPHRFRPGRPVAATLAMGTLLLVFCAITGHAAAQEQPGLLDDEDLKKKNPGGLLDDEDVKKKDEGGLLDDADVEKPDKPKPDAGGLLDDTDVGTPDKPADKPDAADAGKDPLQGVDPHLELFAKNNYPSASQCSTCHQQIYNEWRVSNHAYSSISPMFHKFEQRITELSQGTVGYFCMRCHASVGTTLKEERHLPLWQRAKVSTEGVTCITCHRVSEEYGRVNGERRIEPGDIHNPVFGTSDGSGLRKVLEEMPGLVDPTGEKTQGADIHARAIKFETLNKSEFCVSCHQVAVHPGIKLEVVWDQYRASPAFEKGISCQDCHMGKTPGVPDGYEEASAAIVGGKPTPKRKHANHSFYGPGYPIAHPGIFPHNPAADEWPIDVWLKFNYRSDWGTDAFEQKVFAGEIKPDFPKEWSKLGDRRKARKVIDENLEYLEKKKRDRLAVMENGSRIDGPFFKTPPRVGRDFKFYYTVTNTDPGHNLPSGSLGAQPEIWLNVALAGPDSKPRRPLWESGYVDKNGDMADLHSLEVRAGRLAHDGQLFNLQTKFLTTNVKGTDREMYLPINVDIDQLPFIRPAGQPITVMNHPPFIRMEGRSLPPLSSRKAHYTVPGKLLTKPGRYRLAVRLRSRAEPIYFMRFCNATIDMERAMNEWMIDIHPYTVEFEVK